MYRVPPAHTIEPRMRWAIIAAVMLCSLGSGMLLTVLLTLDMPYALAISLGIYAVLMAVCAVVSRKNWIIGLYLMAVLGIGLVGACLAIDYLQVFGYVRYGPWGSIITFSLWPLTIGLSFINRFIKLASRRRP